MTETETEMACNPMKGDEEEAPAIAPYKDDPSSALQTGNFVLPPNYVQPPPGAPAGGIWGTQIYRGTKTYMCTGIGVAALFAIGIGCIPSALDTESVYWADGTYYDDTGKIIGRAANSFKPTTAKSAAELLTMQRS